MTFKFKFDLAQKKPIKFKANLSDALAPKTLKKSKECRCKE